MFCFCNFDLVFVSEHVQKFREIQSLLWHINDTAARERLTRSAGMSMLTWPVPTLVG